MDDNAANKFAKALTLANGMTAAMVSSVPPLEHVRQSAGAIIRCAAFFSFFRNLNDALPP
jgi:hypothetical protein